MSRKSVYLFWGGMDMTYIAMFFFASLSRGRIPVYDDYVLTLDLTVQYGNNMPVYLFACSLLLTVSVALTMVLFFMQIQWVRRITCLQIPLRLYLVVPSLPLNSWVAGLVELKQVVMVLVVLVILEAVKVVSLYKFGSRQKAAAL